MKLYNKAVELWQSYKIASAADLDKYLDSFRILFAFHSGKIENEEITYHDTREIFENGRVVEYTGSPRVLFEQQNQKLCYELLKEKIVKKEPLSIELVKEIHKVLTSGTYDERRYIENEERPGEFKKHDYVTGVHEVGSAAEDVEKDLTELIAEVNAYEGKDVLKAAAYLHARFEYIHPFADGNGRVGRTLMNYYLMTHNHPPLIVYNEDVTGKLKWAKNGKEKSPTKYNLLSIMLVNVMHERRKGNGEWEDVQRNTSLQTNGIYNQKMCSSNRN